MQDSPEPMPVSRAAAASHHAIDYRLLAIVCAHALLTQIVYSMLRVTISYRVVELGLPVIWVGLITGASAVLPMLLAVTTGRFVDRGNDALTARMGSIVIVLCCLGYRLTNAHVIELLAFTAVLGVGHMLLMVAQQMLCVRAAANDASRETAFGHYMVCTALGQGGGPLIVGWLGGAQHIPPTRLLFGVAVVLALVAWIISYWIDIKPATPTARTAQAPIVSLRALLQTRGVPTLMIASVITVTAQDLIVIYLPILGAQRGIDVANVGTLLMLRSASAVVSRAFYPPMMRAVGRVPLTVGTMAAAALALTIVAIPVPLPVLYLAMLVTGFGLGIAATLSISNMVDIVPPAARGVALSLRITGNRVGQVSLPVLAGIVATAAGAGGIFAIVAVGLAASAASVQVVRGNA